MIGQWHGGRFFSSIIEKELFGRSQGEDELEKYARRTNEPIEKIALHDASFIEGYARIPFDSQQVLEFLCKKLVLGKGSFSKKNVLLGTPIFVSQGE
jgi:hypothetical protein